MTGTDEEAQAAKLEWACKQIERLYRELADVRVLAERADAKTREVPDPR